MSSQMGRFLIASPGLADPNFLRTVVIIAEHNEEGALGLVVNRPAPAKLSDLWESISGETLKIEAPAFVGGPVQQNAVLFLHGHADLVPSGEPIVPGVFLGTEAELLGKVLRREASREGDVGRVRVFCGYAGWGAGQLDREMRDGSWLTCPASADAVFGSRPERLWATTIGGMGGVFKFFGMTPPDPEMN
ncbi:MAG: YqgE/AlgH family protein [Planctomycetes bacterium]|nr:YqgE/AlgH family protein [Planctomycetota bacterium]